MVESNAVQLDLIFQALSDSTRRSMLRELSDAERTISELAGPYDMSLAAASKHVKVLERAGLVRRTIYGRTHRCRLEPLTLAEVDAWLKFYEQFWSARLDALESFFEPITKEQ